MLTFQSVDHTFKFVSLKAVKSVFIAGTFNSWNSTATPMHLGADGRTWDVKLSLPTGKVLYKFVIDGTIWTTDPAAKREGDGNGNENSVFYALPGDYIRAAKRGDGAITASALGHVQESPYLNFDRGSLTIKIRLRPNDIASKFVVVNGRSFAMTEVTGDQVSTYAVAEVPWARRSKLSYTFWLSDGATSQYYGPAGLSAKASYFELSPATFMPITVPTWTEGAVVYSIFPDRFANGDKKNDPPNVKPWGSDPNWRDFNGGDIAGVRAHVPYLKGLGISGIYFCPIFESPVNHRYETTDYRKIDPAFGTNSELAQLTKELKSSGIRTVLDGVFNHTATQFFAFQDVVRNGANSPYTGWYWFKSFPVRVGENPNYVAWDNFPSLPKFNTNASGPKKYVLETAKYWNDHIDLAGWRLDVAQEVSQDFWRSFRKQVKSLNPEAWIVGENWGNSQQWLKGDQWDSVMNYPFTFNVVGFLKPGSQVTAHQFVGNLFANYNLYAPQVSRNLMNLLGSHDTARILNQLDGNTESRDLAAVIQMTWPGTPCIYYGDELGMNGGRDPQNRRCMDWELDSPKNPTLAMYKKLITVRNDTAELKHGEPVLLSDNGADGAFAFGRTFEGRTAVVAMNRSSRPVTVTVSRSKLGRNTGLLRVAYGANTFAKTATTISIRLEPMRATILVPDRGLQSSISLFSKKRATSIPVPEIQ